MKRLHNELTTPWSLRFEQPTAPKTSAVICDGNGDDLLSSTSLLVARRVTTPCSPTLDIRANAATTAPRLLAALAAILPYAENENHSPLRVLETRWRRGNEGRIGRLRSTPLSKPEPRLRRQRQSARVVNPTGSTSTPSWPHAVRSPPAGALRTCRKSAPN